MGLAFSNSIYPYRMSQKIQLSLKQLKFGSFNLNSVQSEGTQNFIDQSQMLSKRFAQDENIVCVKKDIFKAYICKHL